MGDRVRWMSWSWFGSTWAGRFLARYVKVYREDLIHYGEVYMRRYVLRVIGRGELRLHHTRTADGARQHLHDHPFAFTSILLRGWYTHRIQDSPPRGPTRDVRRRWLSVCTMPLDAAHTITEVGPGGAWTLVLTGRKRIPPHSNEARQAAWGFWVGETFEPAREHFAKHPHREQFGAEIVNYIGGEV